MKVLDFSTLVLTFVQLVMNTATIITLGNLKNVKNYSPIRFLQILSLFQAVGSIIYGIEDPVFRPLNIFAPWASKEDACKVKIDSFKLHYFALMF